jgi:hypothetical protein
MPRPSLRREYPRTLQPLRVWFPRLSASTSHRSFERVLSRISYPRLAGLRGMVECELESRYYCHTLPLNRTRVFLSSIMLS